MERKVIASYYLCNTASINIYDIDYSIQTMILVGINDQEPEWVEETTHYEDDEDEGTFLSIFNPPCQSHNTGVPRLHRPQHSFQHSIRCSYLHLKLIQKQS